MSEESGVSIKVDLDTYQVLYLRKLDTGVPISRQIRDLVSPKKQIKKRTRK
jgi:hypothetical protein